MSTTGERTWLSCAETAKLVRKHLKADFPGVKFSVRSSNYAGGASIDVRWTDGPTAKQVDGVLNLYEGASFDGMIDLKSYHDSILVDEDGTPRTVHFGADFVHGQRELSEEFTAELIAEIEEFNGGPCEPGVELDIQVFEERDENYVTVGSSLANTGGRGNTYHMDVRGLAHQLGFHRAR